MTTIMVNAPVYIDWMLVVVLIISAAVQYVWLGFHGHAVGRWLEAIGFTGLALRIAWTLAEGGDPPIAMISIPFLMLVGVGTSISALREIRVQWVDVRCMRDPDLPCMREDRIQMAVKERKGWHR